MPDRDRVTDARYYSGLSRNVFRFLPLRLTSRDLERMHGIDERIGVGEYEAAIRTYHQVVIEATGGPPSSNALKGTRRVS